MQFRVSFLQTIPIYRKIFPNQDGTRQVGRAEVEGPRVCTKKANKSGNLFQVESINRNRK